MRTDDVCDDRGGDGGRGGGVSSCPGPGKCARVSCILCNSYLRGNGVTSVCNLCVCNTIQCYCGASGGSVPVQFLGQNTEIFFKKETFLKTLVNNYSTFRL